MIPRRPWIRRRELSYRVINALVLRILRRIYHYYGIAGVYQVGSRDIHFVLDGMRFSYSLNEMGCTGNLDYAGGAEDETRRYLMNLVPPNGVVYDIGAHGGVYTISLARYRPDVLVHSFEPLATDLRRNLGLNNLSSDHVHEVAVGRSSGTARMVANRRSSNYVLPAGDNGRTVVVISLDEYAMAHRLPPPDVIKIDIEGMEYFALQGAAGLLRAHRPVVACEINSLHKRYYHDLWEFLVFMKSLNYDLHRLLDGQLRCINGLQKPIEVKDLGATADKVYWFVHSARGA